MADSFYRSVDVYAPCVYVQDARPDTCLMPAGVYHIHSGQIIHVEETTEPIDGVYRLERWQHGEVNS